MSAAVQSAPTDTGGLPTLEVRGARATITLNRPKVMNRIQPEDIVEMVRLLGEVDNNPDLRVLVLAATGRAFSAGAHLGDMHERLGGAIKPEQTLSFEDMTEALEKVRVPTICRLQAGVYGGSTDLALTCDFRIGVEGMRMFMPAGRLGVHYYEGGLRRYVSRLGLNNAKRLFMTAEELDSAELFRIGYLTTLVPPEKLDEAVDALADRICDMAPMAVQGMKRAINEIGHGMLDVPALRQRAAACRASADLKEGVASFKEKRKPVFKGR
jgi:enoyl-CoA hydratase/carnithine racemase